MSNLSAFASRALNKVRARYRGPAWDWPTGTVTRLSYEYRERALNGIPLGTPIAQLQILGPAAWFRRYGEYLNLYYYQLGLIVEVTKNTVSAFNLVFDPPNSMESWHPLADGRLAFMNPSGKWTDLTRATSDAELRSMLGTPSDPGDPDDDDEIIDVYKAPGQTIVTTRHVESGSLVSLEIGKADT